MNDNLEKISRVLVTILYLFAILFLIYGFVKVYQGENAVVYFLLAGCFAIVLTGKKIWDKKR